MNSPGSFRETVPSIAGIADDERSEREKKYGRLSSVFSAVEGWGIFFLLVGVPLMLYSKKSEALTILLAYLAVFIGTRMVLMVRVISFRKGLWYDAKMDSKQIGARIVQTMGFVAMSLLMWILPFPLSLFWLMRLEIFVVGAVAVVVLLTMVRSYMKSRERDKWKRVRWYPPDYHKFSEDELKEAVARALDSQKLHYTVHEEKPSFWTERMMVYDVEPGIRVEVMPFGRGGSTAVQPKEQGAFAIARNIERAIDGAIDSGPVFTVREASFR